MEPQPTPASRKKTGKTTKWLILAGATLLLLGILYHQSRWYYPERENAIAHIEENFRNRQKEFQELATFFDTHPHISYISEHSISYHPPDTTDGPPHTYDPKTAQLTDEATGKQTPCDSASIARNLHTTPETLERIRTLMKQCMIASIIHHKNTPLRLSIEISPLWALWRQASVIRSNSPLQLNEQDQREQLRCTPLPRQGWYILDNL